MNRENLEAKAEKTLHDTDTFRVPVAIDLVAQRLNLTMEAGALGDDVSGMLIIRGERGAIGYNSGHARVRQRCERYANHRSGLVYGVSVRVDCRSFH
jgi:hypothetical protein